VNKFFDTGDMVKMDVKYSGTSSGNLSFRLQEEDGDYWYYLQSFSSLSTEDYTTLYIPFEAFGATYLGGNAPKRVLLYSATAVWFDQHVRQRHLDL
jgi:hypothetical protein